MILTQLMFSANSTKWIVSIINATPACTGKKCQTARYSPQQETAENPTPKLTTCFWQKTFLLRAYVIHLTATGTFLVLSLTLDLLKKKTSNISSLIYREKKKFLRPQILTQVIVTCTHIHIKTHTHYASNACGTPKWMWIFCIVVRSCRRNVLRYRMTRSKCSRYNDDTTNKLIA